MPTLLDRIDRERTLEKVNDQVEAAKSCRINLSKDAERPLELSWCQGRGHRKTLIVVRPGMAVEQPLNKCRSWFGPFDLFKVYEETRDERKLNELREIIAVESERYLKRYDYPREHGRATKTLDITPSGPHRSPDVTLTILNPDGTTEEPVRLHEIYGIGEFESEDIKAGFMQRETPAQVAARLTAELQAKDEQHRREIEEFNKKLAEVSGIVKGFIQGTNVAPAAQAQA